MIKVSVCNAVKVSFVSSSRELAERAYTVVGRGGGELKGYLGRRGRKTRSSDCVLARFDKARELELEPEREREKKETRNKE